MRSIIFSTGLRYCAMLLLVTDLSGGAPPALAQQESAGASASAPEETMTTVTVTARKREESLAEVPSSITAFTADTLKDFNVQSFADYATKTPDLSFTYGGGPTGIAQARTIAIRGITGQNLFGTAGATGFYIDDTPLPGSVDPRVVDLASIEVLKGPQGTLFGESSLGGNVRLITRKPDLDNSGIGYMTQVGGTSGAGSPNGGGNLIGNLVLSPGTLALRMVAYGNYDGGYLTRTYVTDPASPATGNPFLPAARTSVGDQGANTSFGGSLALLWRASDKLDVTLRVLYQNEQDNGFPTAYAPLPEFLPVSYITPRAFDVQSKAFDEWTMPTLDFKWSGQGYSVTWANSYFYRHTRDVEDSTYGTYQELTFPPPNFFYNVVGLPTQPFLWDGEHYLNQVSSEARLSFDPIHNVSGTVGLYYSNSRTRFTIPPTYAQGLSSATIGSPTGPPAESVCGPAPCPENEIWTQTNPQSEEDKSIFGELYYKFLEKWQLTLGARGYWLNQSTDYTANGFLNFGQTASNPQENSQSGINPKVALQLQATEETMVYASASKGFRAGGAQANFPGCSTNIPVEDVTHVRSDTLWTYELGSKIATQKALISMAAYYIDWKNLQQQVALPCGFYLQVNGNEARIWGGEIEANGHLTPELQFRLGLGYENTDITDPGNLALAAVNGNPGVQPGSRVSGVPEYTAFVGGFYTHPLSDNLDGFISADYSYTGNSVSLIVGGAGAEVTRPGFPLLNARIGVERGQSQLSLNFTNITNAKPNLGDVGYVGYATFNSQVAGFPTTPAPPIPQVATLPPFTVMLQYTKSL
jgi:iron complex outermembrane recepter protein